MRSVALALTLLLLLAAPSAAQRVTVQGDLRHPAADTLREILSRDYLLLERDTVLDPASRLERDLVVVGADVRLEGAVQGSVAVLAGRLFLRPGAQVSGTVVTARGDLLSSTLAMVGDTLSIPAEVEVRVERGDGRYLVTLTAPEPPARLAPTGAFGAGIPGYNRVDGVTVRAGARLLLGSDSLSPAMTATLAYRTERSAPGGRVELAVPLGRRRTATLAAGRETLTNDAWIRGELVNSLSTLVVGSDVRDYFESDFLSARLGVAPASSPEEGVGFVAPALELRLSRDRSLTAGTPWSLLRDEPAWRPNPPVDDGTVASAIVGAVTGWRGVTSRWSSDLVVEWSFASRGAEGRELPTFVQFVGNAAWETLLLSSHPLLVRGHLRKTLGTAAAPRQRWGIVGGPGTLPTLPTGDARGDNVLFVESTYSIPLNPLTVPLLGIPSLAFRQATGSAWVTGAPRAEWEQNLGLGVVFRVVSAFAYVNPADGFDSLQIDLAASLPF